MDIIGITFDGEVKSYVILKTIKISKWVDPKNHSMEAIFRLTIEHTRGESGFRKLRQFHMYFGDEDLHNIVLLKREKKKKNLNRKKEEQELQEKISPLRGIIRQIPIQKVGMENDRERKRITVVLEDYDIPEETKKMNIKVLMKFKKSIDVLGDIESETKNSLWFYDCLIEPYLVQTLKWSKEEFMPQLDYLEVWLQIPKELYGSLSAVSVQPVGYFEQMFLLGEEFAGKFRNAGQPLAKKDTLCINWSFPNIGTSSPPEEIEIICGMRKFKVEDSFVRRFEQTPENSILTLREILYMCKVKTLDFRYIISKISNRNLKEVLDIFSTMVFQKYLFPMRANLENLIPVLRHFRDLPYGEEFFSRYDIFHELISCEKSGDISSGRLFSRFQHFQELKDILEPDYATLMQDFIDLAKFAEESRYKDDVLSKINDLDRKWSRRIMYPDRYIFIDILTIWKGIIEMEYEEKVPLPEIDAEIKTKQLAYSDQVGFVLSIRNTGVGEAKELYARLVQTDGYSIITEKSETKALLSSGGRPFEPELVIKPKNTKETIIQFEIHYKDILERDGKNHFAGHLNFIEKRILFQKIENPYIIGKPVTDRKMFYGRKRLLNTIVESFKGKDLTNPIFLSGRRRTGKTSILFHLKEKFKNEFSPVAFDTLEIFGKKSFYQDLMEKIVTELGFTDVEIPDIEHDPFNLFINEFYVKLKRRLNGKKMVLMIDEYQRIDDLITKGNYDDTIIDFLIALAQSREINVILAGFRPPEELQNGKWIDLMRFFTTMNVSFLNKEDAARLILEPVKGLIEYDGGAIHKIISLSGCHPYFVQLICRTIVEHHNLDRTNLIGYTDVATLLSKYLDKGENIFRDIIVAQTSEIERKILSSLCDTLEERKITSVNKFEIEEDLSKREEIIKKTEIEKALSSLEKKEIIKKSTEHPDYYEFTIDLYKHWIKWNLG